MAKINEKTGLVENKYICCEDSELNEIHVYNIDINRDDKYKEVILKYDFGWANYIRIYKSEYLEYTDDSKEGKNKRLKAYIDDNGTPKAYIQGLDDLIDTYCDHHNMIAREDTCEFGDTPQEALRNYLLMKINNTDYDEEPKLPELYVRKDNKFIYLNDYISDEEKWNELTSNCDVYTYGADGFYHKEPVMERVFEKGE